jgi:PAS domain S-box-containing protein
MIQQEENVSLHERFTDLEKKIQFYEQFIRQLPYGVTYEDPTLGLSLSKNVAESSFTLTAIEKDENAKPVFCAQNEHNFPIPFEQIEEKLTPIFDAISHHITFIDKNGNITLCNQRAADDFGFNREDVIGKPIQFLLNIPEHQIKALESLRTGKEMFNEEVLDRNYGICNNRIIRDANGDILRVISVFHYLNTEREAEKLALAGRIAAGIAHEIRNPLTTVRGYLQFLQESVANSVQELFKNLLIPELDRANSIITKFLSITKEHDVKTETFPINTFLQEYIQQLLVSESFLNNITIQYNLAPELNHCFVTMNKHELVQVFLNLFQNSLDAKGDKPLNIIISSKLVEDYIRITFEDNGVGIPPAIVDYVFDPFFSTKDEGTGLGLSVTRKIIQNHNGSIRVNSSSQGTTFTIKLPYERI